MDHQKTGALIRALRLERGLTQRELAEQLHVSARAVSKWETGNGFADISVLEQLSRTLHVGVNELLHGCLENNNTVGGNMKQTRYFVCPVCGSITLCSGNASISCCGRPLEALPPRKAQSEDQLQVEIAENDWFITSKHPMTKECYLSFLAFVTGERIDFIKTYPEWDLQVRIPRRGHGMLLWYSTHSGLCYQLL